MVRVAVLPEVAPELGMVMGVPVMENDGGFVTVSVPEAAVAL
jgi:hypothetical protein